MKKEFSRREFLALTGKGLVSLAFAGAALKFGMPQALAADSSIPVNQLVTGENEMRVVFLKRIDKNKSDAFYILNTTPQGLEVFLIDGGRSNKHCRDELLDLRADILTRAGLAEEINKSGHVLEIKVILSHFHGDHVNELLDNIAKISPRIRLTGLYFPAATALTRDGTYNNDANDDLLKRYKVLTTVNTFHRKYCPQYEVPFGETMDVPSLLGNIRLYASPVDWGAGEYVKWMEDYHFAAKPQNIHSGMATEVINGNCLWMRVEYAGHSVLFTGDTNKKFENRDDEALDLFIARYGEELRSDIVKFPHHGRGRDAACKPCKAHLMTSDPLAACILSGVDGPELAGKVLDTLNVPWYDLNTSDVAYVIKDSGMEKVI
ncbi:MAG: hypothetical protein II343_08150 [Clostridia bacterium]|nr:hypothetical protein [Clostridia bacterium]